MPRANLSSNSLAYLRGDKEICLHKKRNRKGELEKCVYCGRLIVNIYMNLHQKSLICKRNRGTK